MRHAEAEELFQGSQCFCVVSAEVGICSSSSLKLASVMTWSLTRGLTTSRVFQSTWHDLGACLSKPLLAERRKRLKGPVHE